MTSEQSYPCCDKMNGPVWIDGRYCRPVCEVHGYQTEPEARQHQTSELRPAVEVWGDLTKALSFLYRKPDETAEEAAAAVIEADREAVRAEQAAELAKYKALAETLAWALGEAVTWNSHDDEGVAAVWLDQADEALRQYKEAHDV